MPRIDFTRDPVSPPGSVAGFRRKHLGLGPLSLHEGCEMSARIPGNRIYPGTSQFALNDERITYREFLRAAVVLTLVFLAIAAVGFVLRFVWG